MKWDPAARPRSWTWTSPSEREARNVAIYELWQLGWSRQRIAERYDLSPQRISQIVSEFGTRRF